jgi:predicted TIM-barrel fold metal-dependent hydrolase
MTNVLIDAHVHVGPWLLPGLEVLSSTLDDVVDASLRESIEGVATTISDGGSNVELRARVADEDRVDLWFVPWIKPETREAEILLESSGPRVAALKLHPSIDKTPPTAAGYDRVFDVAAEATLPVLIHTGRWQEVAGFELVIERALQHSEVPFVMAHAGGNEFGLRARCCERLIELELNNVWLDLTGLGMPIFTRTLVEKLGYERFLFGSDFPLGHPRVQMAHITAMDLPASHQAAILGGTARSILGPPSNRPGQSP